MALILLMVLLLVTNLEILLTYEAYRTSPVIGEVLEGGPWGDIAVGVTYVGVIHPVAHGTFILLHGDNGL